MVITRQNGNGGPALKGFPIEEDPDTGILGYKVGYCPCPCNKPLLIRTVDVRQVMDKFGMSIDEYDTAFFKIKQKYKKSFLSKVARAFLKATDDD